MTMMNELAEARSFFQHHVPAQVTLLCAVSGGLDSMCLLHFVSTWGQTQGVSVVAAHFNHQLRGEAADRDEAFVRDWCTAHHIPFVSGRGDVRAHAEKTGASIEESARDLRYAFLEQARQAQGCTYILTAHHADDNAETILLNLLRGTGLRGLCGIPPQRDKILRPLLQISRAELADYAAAHQIPYVEDQTNLDPNAASRNLIRLQVMPLLKELNPRAVENMARTAALLKQDERALEIEVGKLLRSAHVIPREAAVLPTDACKEQPKAILSRAIWGLLCSVGGHQQDLTAAHINAVQQLLRSAPGSEISLPYDMTAYRETDALVIRKNPDAPTQVAIVAGERVHFGTWHISLTDHPTVDSYALTLPPDAPLTVTLWQRDDRMTLPGNSGSRSFKRLCVDAGIHPRTRDTLPLLRAGTQVAAAPGIGVDAAFLPQSDSNILYITFHQDAEEETYHAQ